MTKRYKYDDTQYETQTTHHVNGTGKKFRRNKIDGCLGGVCAGIGDYLGLDAIIIRIAFVISLFMTGGVAFWIYIGLWVFVANDNRAPYHRASCNNENFQSRRADPIVPERTRSFKDVKSKYRSLEQRLADLERAITSSEWQLRREFRDLES